MTARFTMSPVELRQIMRCLGCKSQQQLADLIGVSRTTVSVWNNGGGIPRPVAMLLRMMAREQERLAA